MSEDNRNLIGLGIIVAIVVVAVVLIVASVSISTTGRIKTVGLKVYSDASGTVEVSAIEWGSLAPGETAEVILFAKSTSNTDTTLSMTTANWSPASAANFMTVVWDRQGYILKPSEIVAIKIGLSIKTTVTGFENFLFDIILTASG